MAVSLKQRISLDAREAYSKSENDAGCMGLAVQGIRVIRGN